jgi:hypothetical protein
VSICPGSSLMAGSTLPGPGRGGGGTGPATMLGSARSRRWPPVSRASAQRAQARGRQHVGVLVVPVAGGEVDDGLVGQLGGQGRAGVQCGRPPASCWRPRGGHRGHHTQRVTGLSGHCTAGQLPNAEYFRPPQRSAEWVTAPRSSSSGPGTKEGLPGCGANLVAAVSGPTSWTRHAGHADESASAKAAGVAIAQLTADEARSARPGRLLRTSTPGALYSAFNIISVRPY